MIQARMGSSRLPGKVLMNIQGKPILQHIIEFLTFSKLTDQIIVATSTLHEDDRIEEICRNLNTACFRGSATDPLGRFYECAKSFHGDLIVRITADNPLIDPLLVDEVIKVCKESLCDYASNMIHQTYPLGYLVEGLTFATLKKLNDNQKDPLSREHITYHIRQNSGLYNIREIFAPPDLARPHWRLSVDYKEDFDLISKIFERLYTPDSFIKFSSVIKFLDDNEDLLKINKKYQE